MFQNVWKFLCILSYVTREKYHKFNVEGNILPLQKVNVSRKVGAKHNLESQI